MEMTSGCKVVKKSFFFVLVWSLFLTRVVAADYADVTVGEAKTMIDSNSSLVVLDVRNQSEYDSGHIENARLIPADELEGRLDELEKTDTILVYCRTGIRSATASQTLMQNGFLHIYNMLGGITDWIAAGYPVYVKPASIQEAVNNASEGSTIYLSSGLYYEHFTVNKPLTIHGEDKYTTVIDGSDNGTVITVRADNTTITGLTVRNSGCSCTDYSGIYVKNYHQNVNITNNLIVQNGYGVKLIWANNITIDRNEITNNTSGIEAIFFTNSTISRNRISNGSWGLNLNPSSNNTIVENNITGNNVHDIMLYQPSSYNLLLRNNIANSQYGIRLDGSFNTFRQNNIINNTVAIEIRKSSNNTFYENNLIDNNQYLWFLDVGYTNLWDDGPVTGGNYWNNYTGLDLTNDGIGDSAQILDPNNIDNHPLMGRFHRFTTSTGKNLNLISNSTITDFQYSESDSTIRIHVSNATQDQESGFFRATIPHDLMLPPYNVTINNNPTIYIIIYENDTLSMIYLNYQHSTLEIDIIPEFPLLIFPLLFMTIATFTFTAYRRKRFRNLD